jgi:hypothetical protein
MDPVTETPTERSDYALISAIYGTALIGVAASARQRGSLEGRDIVPLSAATFALSKLLVHEKAETWLRAPFVEERAEGSRPKGKRLRYAVGELLSCTRCMGAWTALGLVALRLHSPAAGRTVVGILAASAGNDFLQSGFSYLCAVNNRCEMELRDMQPEDGETSQANGNGSHTAARARS